MNFDEAFERLIGHEGGFQDDPSDFGNWTGGAPGKGDCKGTKFGISARSYPGEDIRGMTLDRAKTIYERDFWGPAGCDAYAEPLRYAMFDLAVNSGVKRAILLLQKAVGETEDGILGPLTLQAVQSMPAVRAAARLYGARLDFMTNTPGWASYNKGWARRIAAELVAL